MPLPDPCRTIAPRLRHHRASGPAALFTFDLTTRLRYDILTPRGPSIGDWRGALPTGRCDLGPRSRNLGGGVRRAAARSDWRSKGRRLDEVAIGQRAQGTGQ